MGRSLSVHALDQRDGSLRERGPIVRVRQPVSGQHA